MTVEVWYATLSKTINAHDNLTGTDIMSKYLCVNFLIKTSVGNVEYQRAYRFCICKGIFNASKLARLIPLYKKLRRK